MVGLVDLLFTCSAMAFTAKRTLANVKSSAISPRQPEVPNLIGEVVIAPYSSLSRAVTEYESGGRVLVVKKNISTVPYRVEAIMKATSAITSAKMTAKSGRA